MFLYDEYASLAVVMCCLALGGDRLMKNGMAECSVCRSRLVSPSAKAIARAYDNRKIRVSSKQRALNVFLVVGDCMLVGLQVILMLLLQYICG